MRPHVALAASAVRRRGGGTGLGAAGEGRGRAESWRWPSARCMSIMQRYRKLRPTPPPEERPWSMPKEDTVEDRDWASSSASSSSAAGAQAETGAWRMPRALSYARAPLPAEARFCAFQPPVQPAEPRSLRVGLAGPPNSGKSSLMNAILGAPISAYSPKVNTTREGLRGIKTSGNVQLVFLDAPGIIPSHDRKKNKELVTKAWRGYNESDVCLLIIDVVKRPTQEVFDIVRKICPLPELGRAEVARRRLAAEEAGTELPAVWLPQGLASEEPHPDSLERSAPNVILVLNKIDKASESRWVKSRELEFRQHGQFGKIFYVSALKEQGISRLMEHLQSLALPRPWMYPADLVTDLPHTEQIKHLVSTYLFKWFNSDVPYKIEQQTVGWTPRLDGSLLIEHEIIVIDSVVARMICGMRTTIVSRLSDQVTYKLKKLWGTNVELKIFVRPLHQRLSRKDRGILTETERGPWYPDQVKARERSAELSSLDQGTPRAGRSSQRTPQA